jgi:2-keto-4-pentenoate hydratase/2-oxohepta-3-ene-1,7-dioic acid hydratase in catechol pathway
MKLATFDDHRIGVVEGDRIVDVTEAAGVDPYRWPPVGMVSLIGAFDRLRPRIEETLKSARRLPLDSVRLKTPVEWPNKIVAYPANFHAHIDEMKSGAGLISTFAASGQGFFLKPASSLSGPGDPIVLPAVQGREIHHECELAIIIGKIGRDIPRERALDHVFGYACLIDAVIRGKEERVMRKAFDSFCPVGPWITTADEAPAPESIEMSLTVNGKLRQQARMTQLIVDIPDMIAMASSVMTLQPGDIIASGTPAGVGPMHDGDRLHIAIPGVGEMRLDVKQGEGGSHGVWQKKEGAEIQV